MLESYNIFSLFTATETVIIPGTAPVKSEQENFFTAFVVTLIILLIIILFVLVFILYRKCCKRNSSGAEKTVNLNGLSPSKMGKYDVSKEKKQSSPPEEVRIEMSENTKLISKGDTTPPLSATTNGGAAKQPPEDDEKANLVVDT